MNLHRQLQEIESNADYLLRKIDFIRDDDLAVIAEIDTRLEELAQVLEERLKTALDEIEYQGDVARQTRQYWYHYKRKPC
jgi:hypothetical protein